MATSEGYAGANFRVWLELQRRNEIGGDRAVNRIPLFVNEITIGTQKTVPTIPHSVRVRWQQESLRHWLSIWV